MEKQIDVTINNPPPPPRGQQPFLFSFFILFIGIIVFYFRYEGKLNEMSQRVYDLDQWRKNSATYRDTAGQQRLRMERKVDSVLLILREQYK